MDKFKLVAIDFVCVFVVTFLAQVIVFGTNLFHTTWATWEEAIASAILSGLTVIVAALSPVVSRYGIGAKK